MSRIYSVQRPACWLTLALTIFICAASASAHARLERSEPKAGSTLRLPPQTMELWFGEELEASTSTATVNDQTGDQATYREPARSPISLASDLLAACPCAILAHKT